MDEKELANMAIEQERLLALIDFTAHSARLRTRAVAAVADHRVFSLFEHDVRDLPGVGVNLAVGEDGEEVWLRVERLRETEPPEPPVGPLRAWLEIFRGPGDEPRLRSELPDGTKLEDHEDRAQIRTLTDLYVTRQWRPWAEEEKRRRRAIRLYRDLFTLSQSMDGGVGGGLLEMVWGAGVSVWRTKDGTLAYPLVTRLVEVALDPDSAAIEVRPRDAEPHLETDWYAAVDNPGVQAVEAQGKAFFKDLSITFSPFDPGTFTSVLRAAVTHLDPDGVYWPERVSPDDRRVPAADAHLRVTDTWVLFARPRTNSVFLQDLERLRARVEEAGALPPAVGALVRDPEEASADVHLPAFRGVSMGTTDGTGGGAQDLFFPKAFNEEQVRIVQLLEVSDGVVVQGPPGTGKTHTIANVICHYLAHGKRVLVTSMKDPALAVLQEQLPEEIRPLAISLLSSEAEGMKQFEHAIERIAAEVQSHDRPMTVRRIEALEREIDGLHRRLAHVDQEASRWARENLESIRLGAETLTPESAAREVAAMGAGAALIPDRLGTGSECEPGFDDQDVVQLREARRALGPDIRYLGSSLPALIELPDSQAVLRQHLDLTQLAVLEEALSRGAIPRLADSSEETLASAEALLADLQSLVALRQEIAAHGQAWTSRMRSVLNAAAPLPALRLLETLADDVRAASDRRTTLLPRAVATPETIELDSAVVVAVERLAEGRSAFGLSGLIGKSTQKRHLEAMRVLGAPPSGSEQWQWVLEHLHQLTDQRQLVARWNALAPEVDLPTVSGEVQQAFTAIVSNVAIYGQLKKQVAAERSIVASAMRLFPEWPEARGVAESESRLAELTEAIRHHLARRRLSSAVGVREEYLRVLEGRSGAIVERIRHFLTHSLGDGSLKDLDLQESWIVLMSELARVLGLQKHLALVEDVTRRIAESGAPAWADRLRAPSEGPIDLDLPDNWRAVWRTRRLATHLEAVDGHERLKQLSNEREQVAGDLANRYREVVTKRTWLRLAENASPRVRSALQAYLTAVRKIGKGTGKRAVRYRQDARQAASAANPAVPCWIMAHYRVSESLPPDLGCFDLVVIDEASQSDLSALPSILRARKVLIVGDDKQVSPDGIGLEEEKVVSLRNRFLSGQVPTYGAQMSPDRSIYDLFKVVFASSGVMLREHFRCVGPIIEYSKREFYNHELRPLRLPKTSERLDPPLVDVLVANAYRADDTNRAEAEFIVGEIEALVSNPALSNRSIGVVSLLADKQARLVWDLLAERIGPEVMRRHRLAAGDARTFQGKERDIMFLSMVVAPNNLGAPATRDIFAQRFNVAASRARDRMYLVRSVSAADLSPADTLRRGLIQHLAAPFAQDTERADSLRERCESAFEREMYDELVGRGYRVTPQVTVGHFRIDLVVEGHNDARLAVECDGDRYHGAEQWAHDMARQRTLERANWSFWRCFASSFIRRRDEVLGDLLRTLAERGIQPIGGEDARPGIHVEYREVDAAAANSQSAGSETERAEGWDGSGAPAADGDGRTAAAPKCPGGDDRAGREQPNGDAEPAGTAAHGLALASGRSVSTQGLSAPRGAQVAPAGGTAVLDARSSGADAGNDSDVAWADYKEYRGPKLPDPRQILPEAVARGLAEIVAVEGPVVAERACTVYLEWAGIERMGHVLLEKFRRAVSTALARGLVVSDEQQPESDWRGQVLRVPGSPAVRLRKRGPRGLEELPASEVRQAGQLLAKTQPWPWGSREHLRAVLEAFDLMRLTPQTETFLREALGRRLSLATGADGR